MEAPKPGHRTFVAGRTGSGKTWAGIYLLSLANWPQTPWIVFDFKGDANIAAIPGAKIVAPDVDLWSLEPGVYVVRPMIFEQDKVEKLLWNAWRRENMGIYIDEGYMIERDSQAMQAVYTQGRSKLISVITLSQRPVGVSRFAVSEADHFQIFHLNDKQDRKRVQEYVPTDLEQPLPPFHSVWYSVAENRVTRLAPVPNMVKIAEIFRARMPKPEPRRKAL